MLQCATLQYVLLWVPGGGMGGWERREQNSDGTVRKARDLIRACDLEHCLMLSKIHYGFLCAINKMAPSYAPCTVPHNPSLMHLHQFILWMEHPGYLPLRPLGSSRSDSLVTY